MALESTKFEENGGRRERHYKDQAVYKYSSALTVALSDCGVRDVQQEWNNDYGK